VKLKPDAPQWNSGYATPRLAVNDQNYGQSQFSCVRELPSAISVEQDEKWEQLRGAPGKARKERQWDCDQAKKAIHEQD
jgi:hypothetical protein